MKGGHLIYCISNASTDCYVNTLTRFNNFLPKNLELDERRDWEVGVVAFGLHLNVKQDFVFDVVQVKSNIVSKAQTNTSYAWPTCLQAKNSYHSLKNIRVGIEFLDSDKLLKLSGQPSLVLLHLRCHI